MRSFDRGPSVPTWTSQVIPLPAGYSPLMVGLAILDCLVKDHHGVVTGIDVRSDGTGSYVVRIPRPPAPFGEE